MEDKKNIESKFSDTYKSITDGEVIGKVISIVHEKVDEETGKYTMGNITVKCEDGLHMYVCNEAKLNEISLLRSQMLATRSKPVFSIYVIPHTLLDGSGVRGRVSGFCPEYD